MPHIHTNQGEHDHTASAYIIRTDPDGTNPRALLHMHRKLNMYLQFGGHVELDEHPWQAIAHELEEESGYNLSQFKVLQPKGKMRRLSNETIEHPLPISFHSHPFNLGGEHFHTDTGFLLVTSEAPAGTPDEGESSDIKEFSAHELATLSNEVIYENVRIQFTWGLDVISNGSEHWELVDTSAFKH